MREQAEDRKSRLSLQTQAVTKDMLHDDCCGGRAQILASSCGLWTSRMYWVDAT
jgi:hypothetical protein